MMFGITLANEQLNESTNSIITIILHLQYTILSEVRQWTSAKNKQQQIQR